MVDSMTNQNLAMGMSFRGVLGNDEEGYGGYDGRVALAMPFSQQIAMGVSGRYMSLEAEGQSAPAEPEPPASAKGFTMDAALRLISCVE